MENEMEKISALMDGEAGGQETHQAMLRLDDTGEARESWAAYHLIGDVMRGEVLPAFDVSRRVAVAIAQEPTVLAPQRSVRTGKPMTYALSAAASVSAIAVVGWMAFQTGNVINPAVEVARTPAAVVQPEVQLVSSPSDGQMNEYLLAHQGVSPSTSLQGVAPYIRTISTASTAGR
jgi:sigma-E factor negative regulatory protein RseA